MQYKTLGKTGLRVSVVGFGGIPIQRGSKEQAAAALKKAEETGINFLDSARGYTVSEEFIGSALAGRRKKWILATKSMARTFEAMANDIEVSLRNLQTDYIDLYQIHNIAKKDEFAKATAEDGAYGALLQAKKEGKIGHIGFTSHSLEVMAEAVETGKFETIMVPYNLVETKCEKLLERARELSIGVIAMKPMAGGAIDDKTLALRYILRNEAVTTAIPGMAEEKEVLENAAAAEQRGPLTAEEKKKIAAVRKELGGTFCRRCNYCAPCTKGIRIPNMFLFAGYMERYHLDDWAKSRYFSEKIRANACIACGQCEKRCPYNLPIIRMLRHVRKLFNE